MVYTFNGKNIRIPDEQLQKICKNLEVSEEKGISIYLEDNGFLENEEQEELEEKAKKVKIKHGATDVDKKPKKTQKERTKKENPTKEMIIRELAQFLPKFAENVKVENIGKLITFTLNGNAYKLDLIQQRKPKESK